MKYNNKVSAATIARTAALLLALANQILSAFGKSPLPSRAARWNSSSPRASPPLRPD